MQNKSKRFHISSVQNDKHSVFIFNFVFSQKGVLKFDVALTLPFLFEICKVNKVLQGQT